MTSTNKYQIPLIEKVSKFRRLLSSTIRLRRWLPGYRGHRNDVVSVPNFFKALLLHVQPVQGNTFKQKTKKLVSQFSIVAKS